MVGPDPKEIVRTGYDVLSYRYRADEADAGQYGPWLRRLVELLPAGGRVLDLGCGCGVPVARDLTAAGCAVTGVDLSAVQIARARRLVPAATFLQADAVTASFDAASFDAVVCLYALIHVPQDEQPPLLARIATWLRPGGWLLATTGHQAWTGTDATWLGGTTPMWWSHADSDTYRRWITDAGLRVDAEEFIPEGTDGHTLFWAQRPGQPADRHA